jgi:16S rRNA (guanine527-N7)-methyltransferase
VLSELCLPFVKVGGSFVAMKSSKTEEELAPVRKEDLFRKLGGEKEPIVREVVLRGNGEELTRTVITVKKALKTPDTFPRSYSQIMKSDKKRKIGK